MTILSPVTPKTWINTLVLAGMGVLAIATTAPAQGPHSYASREAVAVSLDDAFVGDDAFFANEVSQVGCFDHLWEDSSHGSCDSCDGCGQSVKQCCCCEPWWTHRTGAFGEFLLLRPGSADQIYTIEQNSVVPGENPTGPVGRVNIDSQPAYRVGFSLCCSECTSLVGSFTRFEGDTSNTIVANPGNFLNPITVHPSTITTGSTALQSGATYSIDFQLADLAYRHIWKACDLYSVNWLAGFRYGQMREDLLTQQAVSVATGLATVKTDVDFDGFGMTFGIDGERRSCHSGMMIYGRGLSSFLAGNWTGSYVQTNQFGGGVVANQYEDYRVTPVLELELGLGWRSCCGRYRASAGYLTSAWYDAVSTREYINAVRNTNYVSIDDTMTFTGLTTRIELNF